MQLKTDHKINWTQLTIKSTIKISNYLIMTNNKMKKKWNSQGYPTQAIQNLCYYFGLYSSALPYLDIQNYHPPASFLMRLYSTATRVKPLLYIFEVGHWWLGYSCSQIFSANLLNIVFHKTFSSLGLCVAIRVLDIKSMIGKLISQSWFKTGNLGVLCTNIFIALFRKF